LDLAIQAWQGYLKQGDSRERGLVSLRLSQALLARHRERPDAPLVASGSEVPGAGAKTVGPQQEPAADLVLALNHARKAVAEFARDAKSREAANLLVREIVESMPGAARQRFATPRSEEELYRLTGLVDARESEQAIEVADTLLKSLPAAQRFGAIGCEARIQKAKALS